MSDAVIKLEALEWGESRIADTFVVIKHLPEGIWEPLDMTNKTIEIDNILYRVGATEHFLIARSSQNPYKLKFGLHLIRL